MFAKKLKDLRTERQLTQNELSLKTGLSHGCIAMLEVGKRAPTGSTLILLADALECSVDYLLGREDDFGNITIQKEKSSVDLTADEKELMDIFKSLHHQHQVQILEYARYFAMRNSTIAPKKKA